MSVSVHSPLFHQSCRRCDVIEVAKVGSRTTSRPEGAMPRVAWPWVKLDCSSTRREVWVRWHGAGHELGEAAAPREVNREGKGGAGSPVASVIGLHPEAHLDGAPVYAQQREAARKGDGDVAALYASLHATHKVDTEPILCAGLDAPLRR